MAEKTLSVVTFADSRDTVPQGNGTPRPWEWFANLLQRHDRRAAKEGILFSPVRYRDGTERGSANVEVVTAFVLDMEHCGPYDLYAPQWPWAHVAYSTWRHRPEEPRYRVVFPLREPVPAAQWKETWRRLNAAVADGKSDAACSDAARMYYFPAAPPDGEVFAVRVDGEWLDAAAVAAPARGEEPGAAVAQNEHEQRGGVGWRFNRHGAQEALQALRDAGATIHREDGAVLHLTRPGKRTEEGASGTWGFVALAGGRVPCLHVFSSEWEPFAAGGTYTPFQVVAQLRHGGDLAAAAAALDAAGYGVPLKCCTDLGNARRLLLLHGEDLLFCRQTGAQWYVWDGARYAPDDTDTVAAMAQDICLHVAAEAAAVEQQAARTEDEDDRRRMVAVAEAYRKWARTSESADRMAAAVRTAAACREVAVSAAQLDADVAHVAAVNGVLHVGTADEDGTLAVLPADRKYRHTLLLGARLTPGARSAEWERFLQRVLPDAAVRAYVQTIAGTWLLPANEEERVYLLHGLGGTGKGTFIGTVLEAFGDYGAVTPFSTWLRGDKEQARYDLAALRAARLVVSSEASEGQRFDESVLKQASGRDKITARNPYGRYFTYEPRFNIVLAANTRPYVRGDDTGFWRRMVEVPFTQVIPEEEVNKALKAQLRRPEHLEAVLWWCVEGLRAYFAAGRQVAVPDGVREATAAYRQEADAERLFVDECCVLDAQGRTLQAELYAAYRPWADANGFQPRNALNFKKALLRMGFWEERDARGARCIGGVALATAARP